MRLFASIVPGDAALAHLERALAGLRGPAGRRSPLRWVAPDQWHVTLAFYGELPDGVVPGLGEALAARVADLPAARLRCRGAGTFAGRTLWAGVTGEGARDAAVLTELVRAARAAGEDVGVAAQERPRNRAHLTVARARAGGHAPDLAPVVRALAVYEGPAWPVREVLLVRSRLGEGRGGGPAHDVVAHLATGA